jgi:hypothetical protein
MGVVRQCLLVMQLNQLRIQCNMLCALCFLLRRQLVGRRCAGKKSRQLLEESDSEEEEAEAPKPPPAKRSKPTAGGGAKRAAGSGGAAKKSGGAKRKQPAKAAGEGGEGEGAEGEGEQSVEADAGAATGAKWGTVKVRANEQGASPGRPLPPHNLCPPACRSPCPAAPPASCSAVPPLLSVKTKRPVQCPCWHSIASRFGHALPPGAGGKRKRRVMRTFYNDAGEEVTGKLWQWQHAMLVASHCLPASCHRTASSWLVFWCGCCQYLAAALS